MRIFFVIVLLSVLLSAAPPFPAGDSKFKNSRFKTTTPPASDALPSLVGRGRGRGGAAGRRGGIVETRCFASLRESARHSLQTMSGRKQGARNGFVYCGRAEATLCGRPCPRLGQPFACDWANTQVRPCTPPPPAGTRSIASLQRARRPSTRHISPLPCGEGPGERWAAAVEGGEGGGYGRRCCLNL
jgi:hypothetical protein